jgi:hypothetical protein
VSGFADYLAKLEEAQLRGQEELTRTGQLETWIDDADLRVELERCEAWLKTTERSFWLARGRLRNEQNPERRAILVRELAEAQERNRQAQHRHQEALRRVKGET